MFILQYRLCVYVWERESVHCNDCQSTDSPSHTPTLTLNIVLYVDWDKLCVINVVYKLTYQAISEYSELYLIRETERERGPEKRTCGCSCPFIDVCVCKTSFRAYLWRKQQFKCKLIWSKLSSISWGFEQTIKMEIELFSLDVFTF